MSPFEDIESNERFFYRFMALITFATADVIMAAETTTPKLSLN